MEIIKWNDDNTEEVIMRVVKVNKRGEISLKKMYRNKLQSEIPEYYTVIWISDTDMQLIPCKLDHKDD